MTTAERGRVYGAVAAALLLAGAVNTNITTSNIVASYSVDGDTHTDEIGIWRKRVGNETLPTRCDNGRGDEKGPCDACCKALNSKCTSLKSFAVIAALSACVSLIGAVSSRAGVAGGILCLIANLTNVIVTASLMVGKFYRDSDSYQLNTGSDCGFAGVEGEKVHGGVAFWIGVASCGVCLAQLYFFSRTEAERSAYSVV